MNFVSKALEILHSTNGRLYISDSIDRFKLDNSTGGHRMRPRKLLSILLAMVFVVSSFSATVLADEDWETYTTVDGLTMSLPSDFGTIWYGMSEDDPIFEEDEFLTYDFVESGYSEAHIQLQSNSSIPGYEGEEDPFLFAISFVDDAPETLDEDTLINSSFELVSLCPR